MNADSHATIHGLDPASLCLDMAGLEARSTPLTILGGPQKASCIFTHLFACDRISDQRQIFQLLQALKRVQVCELGEAVLGENEGRKVGNVRRKGRLDAADPVLREKQGA